MIGHGGPRTSRGRPASTARFTAARWGCRIALLVLLTLAPRGLVAETMRIRIAWGGGSERLWNGSVSVNPDGTLAEPSPLGIEADEPGSMWLESGQLRIRQRSARGYDGVDLLVTADLQAKLQLDLSAADDPENPVRVEVPLADLVDQFYDRQLDAQGNRLLVRRTPGDELRVRLERDSLVFSPGEVFKLTLEPHLLPVAANTKIEIKAQLVDAQGQADGWSAQHELLTGRPVTIPLHVKLPDEEGVYDLVIAAARPANWQQAVPSPLRPKDWTTAVAQRTVQVLVLDPGRRVPAIGSESALRQVVEIDPANPKWHEKLGLDRLPTFPKLPRLWKARPLGNGNASTRQHPLGELIQLNPSRQSPDVSWEAYWLPIDQPDRPHVLEVEYPSDVSQTLGISIVEPNAAGALMPIGLDSGIDTSEEIAGSRQPPRWLRHRLVFWPRTTTPMVLMTNRRDRRPAVYGKIRVLAGGDHLPRTVASPPGDQPSRLLAAYLDRPLFPENFSAREALDGWSGRSLDDWQTFYQGGTRLVEYLHHVGYNGLMIAVLADGSTIYPSQVLQPTPRYDTGVFFATAQDPVRKDVLEMLFRLFDREGLQLIPMIEFAAPLPESEDLRRRGGPESEGIEWIGPGGATWCQTHPTWRAMAPYYNVLHPSVQNAMLAVVRELVKKYAHHESFAGLSIRLSGNGYAQLPGPLWGMDDTTVARFQRDAKLRVPGSGANRFAERAAFLNSDESRPLWLQWRAGQLSQFFRRARDELPGNRLYLAGANVLVGTELQADLRPVLPQRTTIADSLLRVGINVEHYQSDERLVFLRPERMTPTERLGAKAVDLEVNQMPDVDDYFSGLSIPGSLFFHQPQEVRIESFDRKSPFQPTYTWLVAQPVPSGRQNRRRFVHSLAALDSHVLADGGWMLPLGQEESIRDIVAAYRLLPAVPFGRAGDLRGADSSQPVTFRYGTHAGRTYVYVVNDAPFGTTARVLVDAPAGCRLQEITGLRQVSPLKQDADGTYWMVQLRPYDLVAVQLSAPGVRLSRPQVSLPGVVETALGQRIRELADRAASLGNPPPPLKVLANPGFERPPADENQLPGWTAPQRAEVATGPDKVQKHGGNQSARIASNGPPACLVSQPFEPPATGRLLMSVWLRVANAAVQPSLQLAFEGNLHGERYYRWAEIGAAPGTAKAATPIGTNWAQFVFPIDDLPLEGLTQLHVRFDLIGPGEVWIDDVQLFDRAFSGNEVKELTKLIMLAHVTLQNGKVGDCMRLLEGYWPQFLEENVPLRPGPIAQKPDRSRPPAATPSRQSPGILDRIKGILPRSHRS